MRTGPAGHEQPRKLVVVGQGYVGLPLAVAAVEAGYHVLGIDIDRARVRRLRRGESDVDDIPDSLLRDALDTGKSWDASRPGIRSGRLEAWSAVSDDGVWKFERLEEIGTPWSIVNVPTGIEVGTWAGTLSEAREMTANGSALADVELQTAHQRGTNARNIQVVAPQASPTPNQTPRIGCQSNQPAARKSP